MWACTCQGNVIRVRTAKARLVLQHHSLNCLSQILQTLFLIFLCMNRHSVLPMLSDVTRSFSALVYFMWYFPPYSQKHMYQDSFCSKININWFVVWRHPGWRWNCYFYYEGAYVCSVVQSTIFISRLCLSENEPGGLLFSCYEKEWELCYPIARTYRTNNVCHGGRIVDFSVWEKCQQ